MICLGCVRMDPRFMGESRNEVVFRPGRRFKTPEGGEDVL